MSTWFLQIYANRKNELNDAQKFNVIKFRLKSTNVEVP